MTTLKTPSKLAPATDPIFALIAAHKAAVKEANRTYSLLDETEFDARKKFGTRPDEYFAWRGRTVSRDSEIDEVCENLRSSGGLGADRIAEIEKEALDAKERLIDAQRAHKAWYVRTGIEPLRNLNEQAALNEDAAALKLSRVAPTTVAGAAALVAYVALDVKEPFDTRWTDRALKTIAAALSKMSQETEANISRKPQRARKMRRAA